MIGLGVQSGGPATAAAVSFSDWTVEGASGAGQWTVSDGGATVIQEINGAPTFLVSPTNLTEDTFTGTITPLASGGDGDYFGVVLGYTDPLGANSDACDADEATCPNDYVLFDWKHDDQGVAKAGYSLIRVNGNYEMNDGGDEPSCHWAHVDGADCDILDSDFAPANGWAFDTAYTLRFTYTSTLVRVERIVNNVATTLLEATGTFPAGRVGFYNYSQADVRYAGFDAQQATTTTSSSTSSTIVGTSTTSTTTSSTTSSTTSTTIANATTTTSNPTTTSTTRPATTSTTRQVVLSGRTGLDDGPTQMLLGAALLGIGALLTAARGKRPDGRYFS
jgi:hypothetical protein